MGSRGKGGVKGYLGSVSYGVVQESPVAVLIAKGNAQKHDNEQHNEQQQTLEPGLHLRHMYKLRHYDQLLLPNGGYGKLCHANLQRLRLGGWACGKHIHYGYSCSCSLLKKSNKQ